MPAVQLRGVLSTKAVSKGLVSTYWRTLGTGLVTGVFRYTALQTLPGLESQQSLVLYLRSGKKTNAWHFSS